MVFATKTGHTSLVKYARSRIGTNGKISNLLPLDDVFNVLLTNDNFIHVFLKVFDDRKRSIGNRTYIFEEKIHHLCTKHQTPIKIPHTAILKLIPLDF